MRQPLFLIVELLSLIKSRGPQPVRLGGIMGALVNCSNHRWLTLKTDPEGLAIGRMAMKAVHVYILNGP